MHIDKRGGGSEGAVTRSTQPPFHRQFFRRSLHAYTRLNSRDQELGLCLRGAAGSLDGDLRGTPLGFQA